MDGQRIALTYLNIRQSIAILLAKLILTDLIVSMIIVGLYFLLVLGQLFNLFVSTDPYLFLISFGLIGIIKILISSYVVLKWLNEYYEITPESIVHKSGLIFRKIEQYQLANVRAMTIEDSLLGEIFDYATITLYDMRLNKYLDMYLIHNPGRYAKVLQTLKPTIEIKNDRIRLPLLPKEEDIEETAGDAYP